MDFTVWKVVLGGFLIWKYVGWCRNNGTKQNHEDIVYPGDGGDTLRLVVTLLGIIAKLLNGIRYIQLI